MRVFRAALVVTLVANCGHSVFADEGPASAYRAACKRLAKMERTFWDEFPKRQAAAREVARTPWREMVRSMNGRGTRFDRAFDHSAFHALYEDYAQLERERASAATAFAKKQEVDSLRMLWRDLLATCKAIDVAESEVRSIRDPAGETWAGTDQRPGIRRHGLQIRLDGLSQGLAMVRNTAAFLVTKGWKEAAKDDGRRSITRRVAVLDLLALAKSREGTLIAEQALAAKLSSVRLAALECSLCLDPDPRPSLTGLLRDRSPSVRRALLASVRVHALRNPRWIPALVKRLPETDGFERLECLATLAALAGTQLGPSPEAWKAWCEKQRSAIENGTFQPSSQARKTVALPTTTSFFGVTPFSDGIIFALEGGDNLLVPAEYEFQRTRAFLDWVTGKQGWQKEHATHKEIQLREFSQAVSRLGSGTRFAMLFCTDNANVKILGDRKLLRGGTRDTQKAVRFLKSHPPRGYRCELANLRTALDLAGLSVPGFHFVESKADTILFVGDGSLRGGPYLDPDAAVLAFARWNRFRRVALHTIRICNAGPSSEHLMRRLAEVGGGTYRWHRTPR